MHRNVASLGDAVRIDVDKRRCHELAGNAVAQIDLHIHDVRSAQPRRKEVRLRAHRALPDVVDAHSDRDAPANRRRFDLHEDSALTDGRGSFHERFSLDDPRAADRSRGHERGPQRRDELVDDLQCGAFGVLDRVRDLRAGSDEVLSGADTRDRRW